MDYDGPISARARPIEQIETWTRLPPPPGVDGKCNPSWNSVALFYNLPEGTSKPNGYEHSTIAFARTALDEGPDAIEPGVSDFLCNYWRTVSDGKLAFGLDTPRDANGDPIITELPVSWGGSGKWATWVKPLFDANAEASWKAAGSLMLDGKRWVPHIVLMNNFGDGGQAPYAGFERTVAGVDYVVGEQMSIGVPIEPWAPPDAPAKKGRKFWRILVHEYAHNFIELRDLYGPHGCAGYWDLLGDNSPAGRQSEISAAHAERVGWLQYTKVFKGLTKPVSLSLLPYTTSRQAIKIVPDPVNTPDEYFVLEYRKSTGSEVWRPDGALKEEGLLITHYNNRIGIPRTWLNRDAPYFDPEFADGSDGGGAQWTSHEDLDGKLFPQGSHDRFTPTTMPNSNLYDGRDSGVYVTDIEVSGGKLEFKLMVSGTQSKVGWITSSADRGLAGHFTPMSKTRGAEIFIRNDHNAAILRHHQSQWGVEARSSTRVDGWRLGPADREAVGDLDGDGLDEVWIRSAKWAGILEHSGIKLSLRNIAHNEIGDWSLSAADREWLVDLDGDGRDEVFVRRSDAIGVINAPECGAGPGCPAGAALTLGAFHPNAVGTWTLAAADQEVVARIRNADDPEIVVWRNGAMGLLGWDSANDELELVSKHSGSLGGWSLSHNDRIQVGDFDGDGLDELYIRSAQWAGLVEWSGGAFRLMWAAKGPLKGAKSLPLTADDQSHAGRFRIAKHAVLHREPSGKLSLLVWDGSKMSVSQTFANPLPASLASGSRWILGDFHPVDPDPLTQNYVTDGITDVFMHGGSGTGMLGFNPLKVDPVAAKHRRLGTTWRSNERLVRLP